MNETKQKNSLEVFLNKEIRMILDLFVKKIVAFGGFTFKTNTKQVIYVEKDELNKAN
jgi:hypothetical protein